MSEKIDDTEKWLERLDRFKTLYHLETDTDAAKKLGVSQSAMSQIRRKKTQFSTMNKIKLMYRLGDREFQNYINELLGEDPL